MNLASSMLPPLLLGVALAHSPASTAGEPFGRPIELSTIVHTGDRFMDIRLLGTLRLSNTPVDGLGAMELSGIGWDEDDELLYAVSDAGHVVHIRPQFDGGRLIGAELVAAFALRGKDGKPLRRYLADAEGLALRNVANGRHGDAVLLISFEGKPRVDAYSPDGNWLQRLPLPKPLANEKNYACRNCQLESIAETPSLGLVAIPQRPLKTADRAAQSLYDSFDRAWTFAPVASDHSEIVDLAATPDGALLALERRYKNIFSPVIFAIRRLTADPAGYPNGGPLAVRDVAIINNTEGWSIDNFEGLAHHRDSRYFMVSDDGNSALQSTLLVYFEILR